MLSSLACFRLAVVCGLCLLIPVGGGAAERTPTFEADIEPLLSRFGCNTSGCHGKAEGQNGFKLSVFGFDPDADYRAIVSEARGRRVFPAAAERSLLLRKASGGVPHGGGVRIDPDRPEYATLAAWIAAGHPRAQPGDPTVAKIELSPREKQLAMQSSEPLRVTATWSDGTTRDVTHLCRFQSNSDSLASVDENGIITVGDNPGVVAIMASFMGQVDVFTAIVPRAEPLTTALPAGHNFIDEHVYRRLAQLRIAPADVCSDADFLRRVHLDLIGKLPTTDEARRFLNDPATDKRAKLVDELLLRPEFADYWALKFSDLLRVDRQVLGHRAAHAQYQWIRASLAANKPLDELTREIITAEGPLAEVPQGYLFKTVGEPGQAASAVAQIFLGVRIECAQCHHHPYDRWSQTDYAGMAAFFAPLSRKPSHRGELLVAAGKAEMKHPRTGETIAAQVLGGAPIATRSVSEGSSPIATRSVSEGSSGDRRAELAAWMTSPENPYFARNWSNRLWAHFLGSGLIEPVDDLRVTNPPTNPALLDALARHFAESKYDLRQLMRTIIASRTYQHSTGPNATNERETRSYARFPLKRLDAEVLLDAVCDTTGVPEKFEGVASGARAVELWDSQVDHYFLRLFGRPTRQSVCECERVTEPSVAQVLHLLNSERVQQKLAREDGRVHDLARRYTDNDTLAEELYLSFFSRKPTDEEKRVAAKHLSSAGEREEDRAAAAEDLAWSLLNSLEFVFNH